MTALAYLHEHGLDAEPLSADQIAVWPEEAITAAMECWIVEHKTQLLTEMRHSRLNAAQLRRYEQAWRSAHELFLNHIMACPACYAPSNKYCNSGAELRRIYTETYQGPEV